MSNQEAIGALLSLKDLQGIVGSFLVSQTGAIIAQDMPSYFGSAAYDVGPRALRLREAMDLSEGDLDHCTIRYGNHKLSLKPVGGGVLTVLAEATVNAPALRMATNLVARKLGRMQLSDGTVQGTPAPPTARPPAVRAPGHTAPAAPEAASARPGTQKRALYFRGKRVR